MCLVFYESFTLELIFTAEWYTDSNVMSFVKPISSFKIGSIFGVIDPIPGGLRSRVVYKFACAGCNARYVGETVQNFSTRMKICEGAFSQ